MFRKETEKNMNRVVDKWNKLTRSIADMNSSAASSYILMDHTASPFSTHLLVLGNGHREAAKLIKLDRHLPALMAGQSGLELPLEEVVNDAVVSHLVQLPRLPCCLAVRPPIEVWGFRNVWFLLDSV